MILDDFAEYLKTGKSRSMNTIVNYKSDVRFFFQYLYVNKGKTDKEMKDVDVNKIPKEFIKQVTEEDISEYIKYMFYELELVDTSRARKLSSLNTFFDYAMRKAKLIIINPMMDISMPQIKDRVPIALSIDEQHKLLSVIDGDYKERDLCIIKFFLNCGFRLQELISININQIKGDKLITLGKGNKPRTIYFNEECIKPLQQYLTVRPNIPGEKALFLSRLNKRISRTTVQTMVKGYMKDAGLDLEYHTHTLRASYASNQIKYGHTDVMTLKEMMGHNSVETTKRYIKIDDEQKRIAANSVCV
jgi:site-specific recombinase XerD